MSYKVNDALANAALSGAGLAPAIAGGFLHFFAGPVPATPDAALDMVAAHTLLVIVSVGGDGVTGLTFDAATGGALPKAAAETWTGTASFSGSGAAAPELDATFFRFCAAGDNGQGAGSGPRLQGTVGITGSGADMERASVTIATGAAVPVSSFFVRIGSIA